MYTITTLDDDPLARRVVSIGSPMAEVFSVRMNKDGEKPMDLYGTIEVTDGLGKFYIYNRARNDYESIRPGETVTLMGPYRAISSLNVTINLDLKDKDTDDEISNSYVYWCTYGNSFNWNDYNKTLCTMPKSVVNGEYEKVVVYYAIFSKALEATIQVIFVKGDEENPADVYGSVVAHYKDDFFSGIDVDEKKYYQSILFSENSSNCINVRPRDFIPLSRSVVVVPTKSSLIIEANLWDHDRTDVGEIVKGTVEFYPQPNMPTEKDIDGRFGKIIVRVSWSTLCGGNL